ncbi:MAG: hypothetical protein Q9157_002448, partial [Trypethelium eluteriae]
MFPSSTSKLKNRTQFWKTFFEQSANITLNTYSEDPVEADTTNDELEQKLAQEGESYGSLSLHGDGTVSSSRIEHPYGPDNPETDSSLLDSPSVAGAQSTPRAPSNTKLMDQDAGAPTFAEYSSPYESLRSQ